MGLTGRDSGREVDSSGNSSSALSKKDVHSTFAIESLDLYASNNDSFLARRSYKKVFTYS